MSLVLAKHPAVELAENRLRQHIKRCLPQTSVWLFGSRARGDAMRRSDFDLAVEAPEGFDRANIVKLQEAILEDPEIIYPVDVVDLAEAPDALRQRVKEEGILWTS